MSQPKHTLYRFFGADNELLYIGRTVDARGRWRSHERTKDWFDAVVTVTREIHESANLLAAAEVRAIQFEHPKHNVMHNGGKRAARPKHTPASDELLATRWWNLAGKSAVVEPVPRCEGPNVESWCDCASCHALRMNEVEAVRDEFNFDPTVGRHIDDLIEQYRNGAPAGDWICDLLDIRIFRPLQLAILSGDVGPLPVFAEVTERGISVECPFCAGQHEHFLTSGHALAGRLEAPCRFNGAYRVASSPDWLMAQEELRAWLTKHEPIARAA